MPKTKNKVKILEKLANELLSLLGADARAEVGEDKEGNSLTVNVATEDATGLLIGRHGDTLSSLQSILGLALRSKTGEWSRVIVNVGDWRERQEEKLMEIAKSAAAKVKETGESQPLYNLTPSQRRIVHMVLVDDPEVETESQGEGDERFLLVKPKKATKD